MDHFTEKIFAFETCRDPGIIYCGQRLGSVGHSFGPYRLPTYIITLVTGGEATLRYGAGEATLGKDCLYVMFPRSGARYECAEGVPWSIKWVVLEGESVGRYLGLLGLTPEKPWTVLASAGQTGQILDRLFARFDAGALPEKLTCIADIFHLFASIADGAHPASPQSSAIAAADAYIAQHFTEPIRIRDLARQVGLSAHYFSTLFRAETGQSPHEAIVSRRMAMACRLLRFTDERVRTVAARVGYPDELYFSRVFRQRMGMAPGAYRNAQG